MALVRGRETYTFLEIAKCSPAQDWGDTATSPWYPIALISEDLDIERDPLPDSEEISSLGAREALESGRLSIQGSITVRPRWDAVWWGWLWSSLGTENVFGNRWLDNTSPAGGASSPTAHVYAMSQSVPDSFNIRITKAGPDLTTPASSFLFRGIVVSEVNFEQPNDNHPQATFTLAGKDAVVAAAVSPLGTTTGSVVAKLRDLDQWKSSGATDYQSRLIYRGTTATTTYTDLSNVNSFTINVNRGLDFDDPSVDTPDTQTKPGPQNQREVTLEIEGKYEQTSPVPGAGHPYHDYINDNITGFGVFYSSSTLQDVSATSPPPYGFGIVIPRMVWTAGGATIDTGGTLTYTGSATAIAATDVDAYTLAPDGVSTSSWFTTPANPEAYFVQACALEAGGSPLLPSHFGPGTTGA